MDDQDHLLGNIQTYGIEQQSRPHVLTYYPKFFQNIMHIISFLTFISVGIISIDSLRLVSKILNTRLSPFYYSLFSNKCSIDFISWTFARHLSSLFAPNRNNSDHSSNIKSYKDMYDSYLCTVQCKYRFYRTFDDSMVLVTGKYHDSIQHMGYGWKLEWDE